MALSFLNSLIKTGTSAASQYLTGGLVDAQYDPGSGNFSIRPGQPVATVTNAVIDIAQGKDPKTAALEAVLGGSAGDFAGVDFGAPTSNVSSTIAAAMEDVISPGYPTLQAFGGIGGQVSATPYDAGEFSDGSGGFLKYPLDLETTQPTWMEIWPYKRTGTAMGARHTDADFSLQKVNGSSHVILPIPTGVGVQYGQSWQSGEISMIQEGLYTGLANAAQSTIDQIKNPSRSPHADAPTAGAVVQGLISKASANLSYQDAGIDALVEKSIENIAGKTLSDVFGAGAFQSGTGRAAMSKIMVHYSGPQFREFGYSYSFKPQSRQEQQTIAKIVNFLKLGSAPEMLNPGGLGRLYELPFFFKIKYMSPNGEITHMNKIGWCALTGISVKYGGDRFQTFAGDFTPVQTDLSLNFLEIQLMDKGSIRRGY